MDAIGNIMLSEESQVQKHKGHMFSLICVRQTPKINIYTKTSIIIYKLSCRNSEWNSEKGESKE
jgi:hypothetical protein